jgi:glucose-6-phosphate 1-dehydrogenase
MTQEHPTTLVIFGGTGDLFKRKIAPSLFTLFEEGTLPKKLCVIGTGRTQHDVTSYRALVRSALHELLAVEAPEAFLSHFEYVAGEVHDAHLYSALEQKIFEWEASCEVEYSDLIWYFSIAPELYNTITVHLGSETTLRSRPAKTVQVLLEKPLGYSGGSSAALDKTLLSVFNESQLVRIEHYLTKETLNYLPKYRAARPDIDALLNRDSVASIRASLHETIGVEKRGAFFDGVGALRDVGQNHLLEMLAITCMEIPSEMTTASLQQSRIDFLERLPVVQHQEVMQHSRRLQHEEYPSIAGVAPGSLIETAFELRTRLTTKRWEGVQVVISAGKRISKRDKKVVCVMKPGVMHAGRNLSSIIFSIDPEVVLLTYRTETGEVVDTHEIRPGHVQKYQYVEEYARILSAAFTAEHQYSVSAREVAALWRFTDQYLETWTENLLPLSFYKKDTMPFIY